MNSFDEMTGSPEHCNILMINSNQISIFLVYVNPEIKLFTRNILSSFCTNLSTWTTAFLMVNSFILSPKDKTLFQLYRCCKILIGAAFKNSYTICKHCLTESTSVTLGSNYWWSGIGLGLLIGNSFGFLRFEASHWVTAELQATWLPFLHLYTEPSRSPWNFNGYCHFVQWSCEDKEGCCHSWTSVGFRDGCTKAAVCIVSPLWKASSGSPSILGQGVQPWALTKFPDFSLTILRFSLTMRHIIGISLLP